MVSCCVVSCHSRSHDRAGKRIANGVRFFSFPAWNQHSGTKVAELTKRRRMAWISAVRRTNITFSSISRHMLVCSKHFHKRKPAYEFFECHPDWVPSLHLDHTEEKPMQTKQFGCRTKRQQRVVGDNAVPVTPLDLAAHTSEMDELRWIDSENLQVLHPSISKLKVVKQKCKKNPPKRRAASVRATNKWVNKTNRLQKHFPGGKPTDRISDPVPAVPTTSKTCKPARRTRGRPPSSAPLTSKRRKTLKNTESACTRNERADHHSHQEGTCNTTVQASMSGCARQNKDASSVVLRLSNRSPLDFEADVKTSSPHAVQKRYILQLFVIKVEPPDEDNWSPSLDQKPPHIKGEQKKADITESTFSPVPVKSEDDEEKPQPSELLYNHPLQIKEEQEEADITEFFINPVTVKGEDEEEKPQFLKLHCSWNEESTASVGSNPDRYSKSDPEDKNSESSETDVSDGNWEEINEAQLDYFSVPVGSTRHESPQRPSSGENPFSCSICLQCFRYGTILHNHDNIHTREKPFRCNVCNAAFGQKLLFVKHMEIHTGETIFSFYE